MNKDQLKIKIEEILKNMGCTDILFPDPKDDLVVVTFNTKNLTSFVADIPGWMYSGTQLDPTQKREYKIDFKKIL